MAEASPVNLEDVAWPALTPELVVSNLEKSLAFWRDLVGFCVLYERPEEVFVYLECDGAHLMLIERDKGDGRRIWETGALDRPFGRGVNFQIQLKEIASPLARLRAAGTKLYLEPEEKWYRTGDRLSGQRQFIVQDPDGYLVRLAESLGEKPLRNEDDDVRR